VKRTIRKSAKRSRRSLKGGSGGAKKSTSSKKKTREQRKNAKLARREKEKQQNAENAKNAENLAEAMEQIGRLVEGGYVPDSVTTEIVPPPLSDDEEEVVGDVGDKVLQSARDILTTEQRAEIDEILSERKPPTQEQIERNRKLLRDAKLAEQKYNTSKIKILSSIPKGSTEPTTAPSEILNTEISPVERLQIQAAVEREIAKFAAE
jgi:hypothetical protein